MNYIKAYEASDGTIHKELADMKKREVGILLTSFTGLHFDLTEDGNVCLAGKLVDNSDALQAILTLTHNSVPALRKPRTRRKKGDKPDTGTAPMFDDKGQPLTKEGVSKAFGQPVPNPSKWESPETPPSDKPGLDLKAAAWILHHAINA